MAALPTGTVTFLFTDIEGSTRLLQASPEAYRVALARHDTIIREAAAAHGGLIFKTVGDGCCIAFASPTEAVRAALDAQTVLWRELQAADAPLRARMALHTGEVEIQDGEYFGAPLHRCSRLLGSARGGQTIVSAATSGLLGDGLPGGAGLTDLGEHRLRDLTRPERVYQLVGPGLPADFPPLHTQSGIPHNLPTRATAFIGREQQIRTVSEALLRPDTRLLTLTGPGGTGKTRLSLQVAGELLDSFPDGVFFVPLGTISDPDLVPSAIAQALDVRETPGRSIVAALGDALRQKRLLLVLDNFEQVVEAAGMVAELIGAAPELTVLVTSRAALRIYGERELTVPPLALPDRRAAPTAAHLAQFEAVRLFMDRAQAVRADLVLTDENAGDIAEICQRLDGLPLALELAAARTRSLTPQAMLQRMERRLPLLTGGARDLPARQRTLRDAIGWSYDLLDTDEQTLFRRLAVFRGCTLELAEAVCAGEIAGPGTASVALSPLDLDALDGIDSLVEKSLLQQHQTVDREPWYLMLETVREFALERLAESGEEAAVQRRHVRAALELAERAETMLHGPEQTVWFARLELEHDNFRSALGWSQAHGYAVPALRLAMALWWYWSGHGHVKEGRERVSSLLARFPLKSQPTENPSRAELHAKLLWAAGMLASMAGDHAAARRLHGEAIEIRQALGDRGGVFNSLEALGTVANFQGDYPAAEAYLDEALTIAREVGDPVSCAMILHALGNVKDALGDLEGARTLYESALAQLPADSPLGAPRLAIAALALDQGRYDEAEAWATPAMNRFREQGDRHVEALGLATLGGVALARGDHASARDLLVESLTIQHQHGNVPGVAQVLERFVGLAAAQGHFEGAMQIAGAADALRRQGGGPMTPSARARLERALEGVRSVLGDSVASEAWKIGQARDLDEAVAAALEMTTPAPADTPDDTSREPGQPDRTPALAPGPLAGLSRREQEVAVLIAQGLTNRQIADRLVITEGTAANHVNHILTKLGFTTRAQIAARVAELGLT